MPFYKLICRECGASFEKQATIQQRTDRAIVCPFCGSAELEPDYAAGSASIVLKASSGDSCPHGGCGCGCACHAGGRH